MKQLHWVDLVSKASNRHEIARVIEKILVHDFPGEIVAVRPYIGGGKSPDAIVHTTVEFAFTGVKQDMNSFVLALQRELAPHGITLEDWSDDGDLPWSFWSWFKDFFRGVLLQHR